MSELKLVPGANRDCGFCGKPLHFGTCDELREAQRKAIEQRKPVPNPIVRN